MRMSEHAPWRVSAVIPAYNRADFLPETIGYLLAQTCPLYEIIVVDDGSTDDTAAVAARFGERVRYLRIENSGAPVARNAGAAAARGDWLWFCDSDDLWRPTYLERCRRLATSPPYPRFLFGDFRIVRDGVWAPASKFSTAPAGFWEQAGAERVPDGAIFTRPLYGDILRFQPIFHSSIVVARSLFDEIGGYDPRFARTGSEDFEFTLRCAAHAPLAAVLEPLVGIRRHGGNFSRNHLRALLGEVDILRHARSHHAAAAKHLALIDSEIARRALDALGTAFAADDHARVLALARDLGSARLDPRSRFKVFMASLPASVRDPLVALARLKNVARAAAA
jgi:glycosyltransferase involved in cell wall biosynthesis